MKHEFSRFRADLEFFYFEAEFVALLLRLGCYTEE